MLYLNLLKNNLKFKNITYYMSSNILLPVSIGEAIDKLTILHIKMDKITDVRRNDVKCEYDLLYDILKESIEKYTLLYETMKRVNLLIWDMMDLLRDGDITEELYLKICKECIQYNDIRFRVKNKINYISKSVLKEQKSYKINRLIITIQKDILNDKILLNIIKYFSFMYDEIVIESDYDINFLKQFFDYDNTILFISSGGDKIIDYKIKVNIENINYTEFEMHKLFNIVISDLNKFK